MLYTFLQLPESTLRPLWGYAATPMWRLAYVNNLTRQHPRRVSLIERSLPTQAIRQLAHEGGLCINSPTLLGCGRYIGIYENSVTLLGFPKAKTLLDLCVTPSCKITLNVKKRQPPLLLTERVSNQKTMLQFYPIFFALCKEEEKKIAESSSGSGNHNSLSFHTYRYICNLSYTLSNNKGGED